MSLGGNKDGERKMVCWWKDTTGTPISSGVGERKYYLGFGRQFAGLSQLRGAHREENVSEVDKKYIENLKFVYADRHHDVQQSLKFANESRMKSKSGFQRFQRTSTLPCLLLFIPPTQRFFIDSLQFPGIPCNLSWRSWNGGGAMIH